MRPPLVHTTHAFLALQSSSNSPLCLQTAAAPGRSAACAAVSSAPMNIPSPGLSRGQQNMTRAPTPTLPRYSPYDHYYTRTGMSNTLHHFLDVSFLGLTIFYCRTGCLRRWWSTTAAMTSASCAAPAPTPGRGWGMRRGAAVRGGPGQQGPGSTTTTTTTRRPGSGWRWGRSSPRVPASSPPQCLLLRRLCQRRQWPHTRYWRWHRGVMQVL